MAPDSNINWNSEQLNQGLACYRRGQFFDAHEHWESAWNRLAGQEKTFLQALIQVTVAFHHLHSGNSVGAASLLRRALRKLEPLPAQFGGIDILQLRAEIVAWLAAIEDSQPFPATPPQIGPVDCLPQQ